MFYGAEGKEGKEDCFKITKGLIEGKCDVKVKINMDRAHRFPHLDMREMNVITRKQCEYAMSTENECTYETVSDMIPLQQNSLTMHCVF